MSTLFDEINQYKGATWAEKEDAWRTANKYDKKPSERPHYERYPHDDEHYGMPPSWYRR